MNRLTTFLLTAALGLAGLNLHAQICADNNVTQFAVVNPTCPGTVNTNNVPSGNYLTVNITSGNTYTFSTCGSGFNTLLTLWNGAAFVAENDDAGGACGNRSTLVWTATYTGTIKLNLDRNSCAHTGGTANISTTCSVPPTNDNPCGATSLTVGTSCTAINSTNVSASATAGPPAPGCAAYSGADVWFSFVAPTGGSINIETAAGTLTDGGVAIYSAASCAGPFTLISCDDSNGPGNMGQAQASGLTSGTTYYARVWGNGGATGTFTICAHALANDNPCGATSLTVGSSCSSIASTNVNATTTTGPPAPGCAAFSAADVWFSFVAPAIGSIAIETTAGTLTDGGAAIYSAGSCNGPFTLLVCDDNNGGGNMSLALYNGLTVGQTYFVRVWGNGGATGTFSICAYAQPNDNPCGATALTVGTSCTNTATTNASSTGTTGVPAPGCAAYSTSDTWFTFVAPSTGTVNMETTASSLTDGGMGLYSATACNGTFTLIECDDNDGTGNMPAIQRTGLTPGTTYYLRMWGNGGATGTFSICVYDPTVVNDNPCGTVVLPVGGSCSSTAGTNVNATATPSIPAPGCAAYTTADVWFSFIAPASGRITLGTTANTLTDAGMAIYSATACAGTFTLVECDDNDGTGNMPAIQRTGLTAGQTYYVRVWGNSGATGTFSICAWDSPPANDNPCAATALTVSASCSNTAATNVGAYATAGIPAPTCGTYTYSDVWFTMVAPASGHINLSTTAGTLTDAAMAVYSATACNGTFTQISCNDNANGGNMPALDLTGLTPGQTYYARVWGNGELTGTFSICAYDMPGDAPCTATVLSVAATCSNTASTNVGASQSGIASPTCGTFTSASEDVWFSVVAPATGHINISTTAGTLTDAAMAVYSATACAGTFTQIGCNDNSNGGNMPAVDLTGLTPGQTYYVRVWGNNALTGTFNICAYDMPRDTPCTAASLPVGTSCVTTASTNVGASQSTGTAPSCGSFSGASDDVWFTFVAPSTGNVTLNTTAGTMTDGAMAAYSAASCTSTLTELDCNNNGGGMPSLVLNGLTSGQTYYVRFWGNGSASGTFNICAYDPTPANDNPCAAVVLPVNVSCVYTAGSNTGASATAGIPAPGCGNYSGADVWFNFVAPASGSVNIGTSTGSLTNGAMALYSASACAGTFTLIVCSDDVVGNMPYISTTGLTPGTTYYIRFWGDGGGTGTFNICVSSFTPIATDNPCTAAVITPGTSCAFSSYTNVGATLTASIPDPGCGGVAAGVDVWFTFTAPPSGFVTIKTQAGTLTNASMALYRASSCSLGMSLIGCDDNSGIGTMPFLSFSDLVGGSTYYLRVWGNGGTTGTFDLCIVQPPTTGTCFYALNMQDAIGDGWGGSTVGISINGGAYTNHTLANGERDVVYIPINAGQLVQLQYTAAGGAQNEITYSLQLGGGALHSAGPTPATGLVYTGVADCNPPTAPTSDCRGSQALCAATNFNGSPSNTGLVADLNFTTRGCLGSNERQGIWYNFTISSGGTLAFTITPNNTSDDYDFAVFGPFLSVDCVNKNAPYRCSYSGNTGNTGLRAGSGDVTEGSTGDKWVDPITVSVGEVYMLYVSNYSLSGLAFGLSWQMAGGASIDCTVLPIELTAFDAVPNADQVDVNWKTASELNNDHFVIERSPDAINFEPLAEVNGAGNSQSTLEYAWHDRDPLPGTSYYRLQQVDFDGRSSYSQVRPVTFTAEADVIRPYPNPARDLLNIPLGSMAAGNATVRIIDAKGAIIRTEQQILGEGTTTLSIAVSSLSPGSYAVQVIGAFDTGIRSGRFVIE